MKKLLFILFVAISSFAFAKPVNNSLKYAHHTFVLSNNKAYTVGQLANAYPTLDVKISHNIVKKLTVAQEICASGLVGDGNGNIIGWWVADCDSGVLLIVIQ